MRRLLALAVLLLVTSCEDCSGISCAMAGLDVSANEVPGGTLEVCAGDRCHVITMPAETQPHQAAPQRTEVGIQLNQLGVWPASYGPPATGAVPPTIFSDKEGFEVRITLKGADGAVIASKEIRTKRESGGCCGPHWSVRI